MDREIVEEIRSQAKFILANVTDPEQMFPLAGEPGAKRHELFQQCVKVDTSIRSLAQACLLAFPDPEPEEDGKPAAPAGWTIIEVSETSILCESPQGHRRRYELRCNP